LRVRVGWREHGENGKEVTAVVTQSPGGGAAMGRTKKRLLIVEDETDLAEMLRSFLERDGYDCTCVHAGSDVRASVRTSPPDLIVLDRMLPGKSGDQVVGELREDPATAAIPVVVLTAKAEETDQLVGFALGADDYITKPFSMKLLVARIRAILRRVEIREQEPDALTQGPIRVITSRHEVSVDGKPIRLTPTEFKLLRVLMSARHRVLDRSQLIDQVFGTTVAITDRAIDVHITALRKKLGSAAPWVQTVRGVGYTFRNPV